MEIDKIVIVTRRTRLEDSVRRFNTRQQAKFFVQSRGQSFDDYELEYANYSTAKEELFRLLPREIKIQEIDRDFLPNFLFGPRDLVITLGQDGLVVNTAKYLNGQKVVAVNPDPARFDGILLPFQTQDIESILTTLLNDKFSVKNITMGRISLPDGQHLYAFNDFFIGPRSHTSALYTLHYKKAVERQISSGIIVSTPAGSTGWLSSLFNMAGGIASYSGNKAKVSQKQMSWEEKKLLFVVREPFKSKWSEINVVAGEIQPGRELILESHMPDSGVIFSDGVLTDFLEFNSGAAATVEIAEKTTDLVMRGKT